MSECEEEQQNVSASASEDRTDSNSNKPKKALKYTISKTEKSKAMAQGNENMANTKTSGRLDNIEKTLDRLIRHYEAEDDNNSTKNKTNNMYRLPPDEDYVSLLPSDDGEYDMDSSSSHLEEENIKPQRKRTSKERTLGIDDDIGSLINKSSKKQKLVQSKNKSK